MTSRKGLALAAIDLLASLFLVALVQMGDPPKPQSAVKTYGLFAYTILWPANCEADEDAYVRDPVGHIVYFAAHENAGMHLENDDIPKSAGYAGANPNFERVVVRQVVPGEYTFNVQTYNIYGCKSTTVRAQLWRLEGDDRLLYQRDVKMDGWGDEHTAFRAVLHEDGGVSGISLLQRKLVG